MQDVKLIGIDLGKHGFHVHGQDQHGKALLRKKFDRKHLITFLATFQPCTVVMEARAGAHWMAGNCRPSATRPNSSLPSSSSPSSRATRMTSSMPRRFAKQPAGYRCVS